MKLESDFYSLPSDGQSAEGHVCDDGGSRRLPWAFMCPKASIDCLACDEQRRVACDEQRRVEPSEDGRPGWPKREEIKSELRMQNSI